MFSMHIRRLTANYSDSTNSIIYTFHVLMTVIQHVRNRQPIRHCTRKTSNSGKICEAVRMTINMEYRALFYTF